MKSIVDSLLHRNNTIYNSFSDNKSSQTEYVRPMRDTDIVHGQNFMVLSYAAPNNSKVRAANIQIKVSGCFDTESEANHQAELIRNADPRFNVNVVCLYEWVTVPILDHVDQFIRKEYTDKRLNAIMRGNYQSLAQSRKEMVKRIEKDKKAALENMRKVKGPDYNFKDTPDSLKQYDDHMVDTGQSVGNTEEHDELMLGQTDVMNAAMTFFTEKEGGEAGSKVAIEFLKYLKSKTDEDNKATSEPQEKPSQVESTEDNNL